MSADPATSDAPTPWRSLPGPSGLPFVGSAFAFRPGAMHRRLERWSERFGPVFRVRIGPSRLLVLSDHREIAAVLRDRPDGFSRVSRMRRVSMELGMKEGVFSANGDAWREQRAFVTRAFAPANVRRWTPELLRVVDRLGERWAAAARDRRSIDLQADLMRFTVDVVAGLALGAEVDTLGGGEHVLQRDLDRIFPTLFRRATAPLPSWRWWPTREDRAAARSLRRVDATVDALITDARRRLMRDPSRRDAPPNLLEALLVESERGGSSIHADTVSGNVMTMLLAGEDTTANTLAWTLYLLAAHPEALRRARDEVSRIAPGDELPDVDALERLRYLDACAQEALRLKPVAPILPVEATRDAVVAGVRVRKGTIVMNLMRRDATDPAHLGQANRFEPGRWLDGAEAAERPGRMSMPFGAGPRLCPGRWLALLEIRAALCMVLQRFEIDSVATADGTPPREHLAFTMAPLGLRLALRPAS